MVLYIAINGKVNDDFIQHLKEFYMKKEYKVKTIKDQPKNETQYILNNTKTPLTSKLLIKAYNRTNCQQNQNNTDIIIKQGSIIDDYTEIQNTDIKPPFLKQINRYTKKYDLYITINTPPIKNIPRKYNHKYINAEAENRVFEETVKTIFDNLPRCNWCGKLFTPSKKLYKYCCKQCSRYGWEEHNRRNNREQYHKYKNTFDEKKKYGLGSKNAYLHGTPEPNPLAELEKVRKAKKSLGL